MDIMRSVPGTGPVASHHNSVLKAFADRLRAAEKPHKVIITVVVRKLVTIVNARCQTHQKCSYIGQCALECVRYLRASLLQGAAPSGLTVPRPLEGFYTAIEKLELHLVLKHSPPSALLCLPERCQYFGVSHLLCNRQRSQSSRTFDYRRCT